MRSSLIFRLILIVGTAALLTALAGQMLRAQTNNVHTTEEKINNAFSQGLSKRTIEETSKYDFYTETVTNHIKAGPVSGTNIYHKVLFVVRHKDTCRDSCAIKLADRYESLGPAVTLLIVKLWLPNELGQEIAELCQDEKKGAGEERSTTHTYEILSPQGETVASIQDRIVEGTTVKRTIQAGEPAHTDYKVFTKGQGWKSVDSATDRTRCSDPKFPFLFYNEADPKP